MSKVATLWTADGWICFRGSFHKETIEQFKSQIKPTHRKMEVTEIPNSKYKDYVWKFDPSVASVMQQILVDNGFEISMIESKTEVVASDDAMSCYRDFIAVVPFDILKEAYRKACLQLHPDRGGSSESIAKLNAAWQTIKEEKQC